ncbi:MAG: hypothetical protein Q7J56_01845 [Deltaproteobacteria bacterium]|nr:hypothetical protein [Deltaproteobacteria bacterium]
MIAPFVLAVEDFITTTQGWGLPILDDRHRPRYPRAVFLTSAQLHEIDDILGEYGLLRNLVPLSDAKLHAGPFAAHNKV